MGFMDKLKNMFTEEVEEEEVLPVKREIKVEIASPRVDRTEKNENVERKFDDRPKKEVSDSESTKREEKFVFPVYFDDKDFDDLEKPTKSVQKEQIKKVMVTPKKEIKKDNAYSGGRGQVQSEERKKFKPSPIISPVYGVLDKNYSKDDIMTKDRSRTIYHNKKEVTVDDIRKKAFGTLEDDLENTMFGKASFLFNNEISDSNIESEVDVEKEKNEELDNDVLDDSKAVVDEFDHMIVKNTKYDDDLDLDLDNMINDELNKLVVDEKLPVFNQSRIKRYENEHNIDDQDSLTDSDLFHLIDTMYEKGDEK